MRRLVAGLILVVSVRPANSSFLLCSVPLTSLVLIVLVKSWCGVVWCGGGPVRIHFCPFQAEVQTITTAGGADGSFTLAFGELDYPLPGIVDVVHGEDYVVTSHDLTPYVKRGDRVSAGGWEYAVHAFRPFNATHLYLAKVLVCGCSYRLEHLINLV